MNIHVNKESFLKSIIIAESAISQKSVNSILSNCLLNVLKDEIEIIATDNDIAIRTRIYTVSDSVFSFTANPKKMSAIIKELPNDEVIINVSDEYMIDIRSRSKELKGHYTLVGLGPDDYPEIPEFKHKNFIEFDQSALKEIIKKVLYAASVDSVKPVFHGLFFQTENKKFIAVATDSRRLSVIERKIETEVDLSEGVIIPYKTISEVYRLLESTGKCKFSYNNNQCFFEIGKTEIISRVVSGQFPNYKQVIPRDHSKLVTVETKKLLNSLKRAMVFTRDPSYRIIIHFDSSTMKIEASTPELGNAEEELFIESNNEEKISVGLNVLFLIDALKEIETPTIKCGITGQMSPLTIMPDNDPDNISVIMPIQIKTQHSE
jgi:DNA polymerase-3 subunit beta